MIKEAHALTWDLWAFVDWGAAGVVTQDAMVTWRALGREGSKIVKITSYHQSVSFREFQPVSPSLLPLTESTTQHALGAGPE